MQNRFFTGPMTFVKAKNTIIQMANAHIAAGQLVMSTPHGIMPAGMWRSTSQMQAGSLSLVSRTAWPNIQNVPRKKNRRASLFKAHVSTDNPFRCCICGRYASSKTADRFTVNNLGVNMTTTGRLSASSMVATDAFTFVHRNCQWHGRFSMLMVLGILTRQ